jgi:hypothetical protein
MLLLGSMVFARSCSSVLERPLKASAASQALVRRKDAKRKRQTPVFVSLAPGQSREQPAAKCGSVLPASVHWVAQSSLA